MSFKCYPFLPFFSVCSSPNSGSQLKLATRGSMHPVPSAFWLGAGRREGSGGAGRGGWGVPPASAGNLSECCPLPASLSCGPCTRVRALTFNPRHCPFPIPYSCCTCLGRQVSGDSRSDWVQGWRRHQTKSSGVLILVHSLCHLLGLSFLTCEMSGLN